MPNPKNMFYTSEAAKIAGISKATLLRWLKEGKIPESARDIRGWRVFTQNEVNHIKEYANTIIPPYPEKEQDN